jgi:hypothetical protein
VFGKVTLTIYLILFAASAASAPVIDEDALRASLKKGTVKVVSIARHLGPPEVPEGAFARACRLIDRLVADGLVERSACLSDGRGAEAVLTTSGLDRLRAASRTHLRGVDAHFLAALDAADGPAVERSMRSIADRAEREGDACRDAVVRRDR